METKDILLTTLSLAYIQTDNSIKDIKLEGEFVKLYYNDGTSKFLTESEVRSDFPSEYLGGQIDTYLLTMSK